MRRNARLAVAGVTTAALVVPLGLALAAQSATAAEPNLAAGKPATASSTVDVYGAGNVTDGNQATYWESTNNQFPQWVQVDLGSAATVTDLTLKLPTGAWGTRTQTITVQGSTNGSTFSTLKNQAGYTFDPGQANTVNVDVTDTSVRYVRLSITGNTGWPAGQLSELEVHGTSTPTPTPTTPTPTTPPTGQNLALSRPIVASSTEWTYAAGNAVDGNLGTYWEGAGGQYPGNLTVTLASASQLSAVTVKLNPDGAWGNRTQTFSVAGPHRHRGVHHPGAVGRSVLQPVDRQHRHRARERHRDRRPARLHRATPARATGRWPSSRCSAPRPPTPTSRSPG